MVPLISPVPVPLPETVSVNFSGFDIPRIVPIYLIGVVPGLHNFGGHKGDHGILLDIKKILALQFSISQAAAGVDAVRLDLDFQIARSFSGRSERYRGVPLIEDRDSHAA
jgi:hypothetical protein